MTEEAALTRIAALEAQVAELTARVAHLEQPVPPAQPSGSAPMPPIEPPAGVPHRTPQPRKSRPATSVTRPRPRPHLTEDLFGGRVLALVGGLAVLLGVLFFLALAIGNGIIGEGARVVLAAAGSLLLIGGGLWLYERKGQTDAAKAAIGVGIAGLFATITTATQVYGFVSPGGGLMLAGVVGTGAVGLAIRLNSHLFAGLGIVGALVSPALVDAPKRVSTLLFMVVALLAATGVVLWRKWSWLSAAAFLVSLPQLIAWVDANTEKIGTVLIVVTLFWLINLAAAVGFEIRTTATALTVPSTGLALLAATSAAAIGWIVLHDQLHHTGEDVWVGALAVVHLAIGVVVHRRGVATNIALALVGIGAVLTAIATALFLDGPGLVVALCAEAGLLAWLSARTSQRGGTLMAFGYIGAATAHTVAIEAPIEALGDGLESLWQATVALLAIAGTLLLLGRLTPAGVFGSRDGPQLRRALPAFAGAAVIYLISVAIVDSLGANEQRAQTTLSAFWAIVGLGLVVLGLVRGIREARFAGLGLLGLAIVKLFVYDLANLSSINRAVSFVAVGLLLLAGAFAYQRVSRTTSEDDGPDDDSATA